jgi:hypothetical protein
LFYKLSICIMFTGFLSESASLGVLQVICSIDGETMVLYLLIF